MLQINPAHMKPNSENGYTIIEAELIYGRISYRNIDRRTLQKAIQKALKFGDEDISNYLLLLQNIMVFEATKAATIRAEEHTKLRTLHEKLGTYTDHEWDIINGKIPFDEVTGNEYSKILTAARQFCDTDTISIIHPLCTAKRKLLANPKRKYEQALEIVKNDLADVPDLMSTELMLLSRYPCYSTVDLPFIDRLNRKIPSRYERYKDYLNFAHDLYAGKTIPLVTYRNASMYY